MRIRTIKPDFFVHERLAKIPALGRLLFQGLWLLADRSGRLHDRPERIKVQILPYDKCELDELLWLLAEGGFIVRYCVEGKRLIEIPAFETHQRPNKHEPNSTELASQDPAAHVHVRASQCVVCDLALAPFHSIPSSSDSSLKIKENSNDREERAARATRPMRLPEDFELTDARRLYAESRGLVAAEVFGAFKDYWLAKPKDNLKLDWDSAFRTWCRREGGDVAVGNGNGALPFARPRAKTAERVYEKPEDYARRQREGQS